jgi:hypothetical protein
VAETLTYSTLLQDLRRYLERGFTAESDPLVYEQLPRLINNAERRIARELKLLGFLVPVTTTLPAETSVLAKPDRWRETVSVRTVDGGAILPRSYDYLRTYWPDDTETAEAVEFYADYNYQHWLFIPPPAEDTELEIMYYELPVLLDEQNQSNWLTQFAPNLLLYASLLEAAPFLKNDDRISTWEAMYMRAAQALNQEDVEGMVDRAAVRNTT